MTRPRAAVDRINITLTGKGQAVAEEMADRLDTTIPAVTRTALSLLKFFEDKKAEGVTFWTSEGDDRPQRIDIVVL